MGWHCKTQRLAKPALIAAAMLPMCVGQALAQQSDSLQPADRAGPRQSAPQLRGTAIENPAPEPETPRSTIGQTANYDQTTPPAPSQGDTSPLYSDLPPADTLAPAEPDLRGQQDRDAFETPRAEAPPAGYNPGVFQIETLDPAQDRRTRQFFENEPFAQLGWRLGSFVLFQEAEISPAWDSNVFFQPAGRSDWRAVFKSETRLVSDWANHALELRMLQNRSYHATFATENDIDQTYEMRGRIDVTSRTTLEAAVSRSIGQESRNSIDSTAGPTGDRADIINDRANLALNHRFNRLTIQLRGSLDETRYDNQSTTDDRDVNGRTVALRGQWEFRPTFSVFGEVQLNDRRHDAITSSDNLSRNSHGERYRAGVALGQTGEFLRGEASIGYGIQHMGARQLPDVEAFLVDANVAWRITPLTSVLFEASTAIDETTQAHSPGVVNRQVGATVRHSFTPRLIGEAGVTYAVQDYRGVALEERSLTFKSNVEYTLNRHAALFGRYENTRFRSTEAGRQYNADTVLVGVRLRN